MSPPCRNLAPTLRDDRLGSFDRRLLHRQLLRRQLLIRRLIGHRTTTPVRRLPVGGLTAPPRPAIIQDDGGNRIPVTSLCGPEVNRRKIAGNSRQREADTTGPSIFTQARASRRTES